MLRRAAFTCLSVLTATILFSFDAHAQQPSFDCAKAGTATEHAICASTSLATLDRALAEAYSARRKALSGGARNALLDQQRSWLRQRDACGGDASCIEAAMRSRLSDLGAAVAGARPSPTPARGRGLVLHPYSRSAGGARLILRDSVLEIEGGDRIPLEKVSESVYRIASQYGHNFCSHLPITYLTLHRHQRGLYVLNVGGWKNPPVSPSPTDLHLSGACSMATYEVD